MMKDKIYACKQVYTLSIIVGGGNFVSGRDENCPDMLKGFPSITGVVWCMLLTCVAEPPPADSTETFEGMERLESVSVLCSDVAPLVESLLLGC